MAGKQHGSKKLQLRLGGERPKQRVNTRGAGAVASQVSLYTREARALELSSAPMTREERMRFDTSAGGWANDQVSIQQTELCERSDGQADGKEKEEEGEGISLTDPQEHLASFYQVSLVHCRVPQ